jgi:hypothetical protein
LLIICLFVGRNTTETENSETITTTYQEGDVAKRLEFERLVSLETGQPLGAVGAAQLVPWVPPYLVNYLVVLADPRKQSGDLRQSMQFLASNLEPEMLSQVIAISADPYLETKG